MRETVDCSKGLVTFTVSRPVMFTQPEITSAPSSTWRGTDSPVSAAVSSWLEPETTMPSSGTRSPGFTTIWSPSEISYGSTFTSSPSRMMLA